MKGIECQMVNALEKIKAGKTCGSVEVVIIYMQEGSPEWWYLSKDPTGAKPWGYVWEQQTWSTEQQVQRPWVRNLLSVFKQLQRSYCNWRGVSKGRVVWAELKGRVIVCWGPCEPFKRLWLSLGDRVWMVLCTRVTELTYICNWLLCAE